MTTTCLSIEEIAGLETADAGDPGRAHVERCARCAALALEYAEFVRGRPDAGSDVGDAGQRLAAFIAERIERDPIETSGTRRLPRRWFELSPRRGLAYAAAAALVLIAAVTVIRTQLAPEQMVLRGAGDGDQLATYTVAADGSIPLIWAPVDGADAYRITILGEDLVELTAIGPVGENTFVFAPAEHALPAGRYFWEITALVGGDPVATVGPAPLFVR